MAEQVQAVLDQMVAPLRDLMDRGIFSEPEIRIIVARRRESEYLLRRRAARKADFLRYIEAEQTLEKLRVLRTQQVLLRQKEETKKKRDDLVNDSDRPSSQKKHHIGDTHIIQHIHFLFTRVIRKYRGDVSLHLEHAKFCKQAKSYSRLSRVYSEALQVHPTNVGLWIEAASLEFFGVPRDDDDDGGGPSKVVGGGAVQPARVLLQRGLRINPKSSDLWLQYFCMELHHLQKLRGRKEILQLADDDEESNSMFQDAKIAVVVFENAIKAIPADVTFRLQFLDLCGGFPETDKLEALIMGSIARDFEDQAEAWIARAMFAIKKGAHNNDNVGFIGNPQKNNTEGEQKGDGNAKGPRKRQRVESFEQDAVLSVLSEAVERLPTPDMYLQSVQFLRATYVQHLSEDDDIVKHAAASKLVEKLLVAGTSDEKATPELVLERASHIQDHGRTDEALGVLQDFAQKQDRVHVPVWLEWARLSHELKASPTPERILRMACDQIPMQDRSHMDVLLELLGVILSNNDGCEETDIESKDHLGDDCLDIFQRILLLSGGRDVHQTEPPVFGIPSVAVASLRLLKHCASDKDVATARKFYDMVLQSTYVETAKGKAPTQLEAVKQFFDECISLEKTELKGDVKKKKQIRQRLHRLYSAAIHFFEDCVPVVSDEYATGRDNDVRYG